MGLPRLGKRRGGAGPAIIEQKIFGKILEDF